MKKILIIALLLCLRQVVFAQNDMQNMSGMQKQQPITYTCPMHPDIHAAKRGNCPKCGMKLIREKPKAAAKKAAKVDMPLKEKNTKLDGMAMGRKPAVLAGTYTCPMHPDIHSAQPGNCPKCGMKLVKEPSKSMEMPDGMNMPVADSTKKNGQMTGMKMDGMDMPAGSVEIQAAKDRLGFIKTVAAKYPPRTVRYDLYIADTSVTYGGKPKRAIAVNGSIPMPTLTFTEGDTAEIYVHNRLKEETSLHWHGLFLPNRYDGVPNMTQMPIPPGATHLYKFPIKQHGTHWYHSHTGLQEQIGMYGAFIMNKRQEWDIPTIPLVLSDWTNMNPKEVSRSLHAATDWFAIKKGTTQSYLEAIQTGHFKTKVGNEWKRMNAMDVSDVYYDKFLINGENQNEQPHFKAGDKVRLRIANGGASSYFWLKYAGGKMTVVATDGNDVEPVEVDRLIIAVSETYDVVVTIPENKSYEFLVTPEDRTKSASLWLGKGEKVYAGKMPKLKYFAGMKMMNDMMDMNGNMVQMDGMAMQNQIMDMNTVMYPEITGEEKPKTDDKKSSMPGMQMGNDKSMSGMNMAADNPDIVTLNYTMLRDPNKTTLPKGPMRELKFDLTGNMNRYVWTLDNKTVSESDKILIKKGENLRIILYNNSMMRHPMHLHGHDFRVLNGQDENAPMKNVIDIMPMERDTIEFAANEQGGDWFFHCHILYHMMSGMGRVFSYENSPPNPDVPDPKLAQRKLFWDDQMPHLMGKVGLESNGTDGQLMLGGTRWKATTMWHLGTGAMMGYESETTVGRYIGRNQWLFPYVGFDYHYKKFNPDEKNIFGSDYKNLFGQVSNKENRHTVVAGIAYTLPMLFVADMRIDGNGKLRFQLGREDIPIAQRLRMTLIINTDKEYTAGLRYIITKYFSLSTHYDSDMGLGGGLTLTY
ncbi:MULTISPECIES: multicopper oxidase domain-containing protein [unclassified Mucilaginibacter]|uniref:multicopper oxidase domain-containing protein n=1 Tax=unclassified Mucilaginibacter TaxID=2617802 RepID=UPI002AC973CA|nr:MULTISPECIES: multicopper oxidase domain-containing protein [unclassified Mucilaginibacter]MEB0278200.1 multicopper oxidase domain-containing protein [Mucilaginibacter sp. 10B2]MEB0302082.1 multicopper oxidase domain-containing protein [Mucilaginibacter sp. 5C4]WPX23846.1 multicopper oxidase domain-containing protein [Mucilaginibacter sp. 5C4]